MSLFNIVHMAWTIAAAIIFVGIFIWAWSGTRKKRFEEAAQLALGEEPPSKELRHG